MRKKIAVIALVFSCVHMDAVADDDIFDYFRMEAETIYAASKYGEKSFTAPANAAVITAEEIEAYGYRTLLEALQSLPGFYGTDDRNYSALWVRGLGRPSDYNNRVLVLLNGHRMNENVYGSVLLAHEFPLHVKAIKQIEVIKGPGSSIHGDSAFLAVVNVVTKTAEESPGVRAYAGAGSYGTYEQFLQLAGHLGEDGSFYSAVSHRGMKGQNLPYAEFSGINGGTAENADKEESIAAYAGFSKSGFLLHGNFGSREKHIPTASFQTLFNDSRTKTVDARSFVELKTDRKLSEKVRFTGRAYYDRYDYAGDYLYDNSAFAPPDVSINKDFAKSSWGGAELTLRLTPFGEKSALLLGQDYEKTFKAHLFSYYEDPYSSLYDATASPYRYAFFAQQEIPLARNIQLTLGGRYDRYQLFGHTFNPRTTLVWTPAASRALKLLYGTAFRAPTIYELNYNYPGQWIPNTSLRPETVKTLEAQWIETFNSGSVRTGYFHSEITSLIDPVIDPDSGLGQYKNSGKVKTDGAEIETRWELPAAFFGRMGYILQWSREESGNTISNSPRSSGSIGLGRKWKFLNAKTSLETFFIGPRRTFQGNTLSSLAFSNLIVSARPWKSGLAIFLGVYNILDAAYAGSGAQEHLQDSIRQNGRNFTAGVQYDFGKSKRE